MINLKKYFNILVKDSDYESFKDELGYVTPHICIMKNKTSIKYKHHIPYLTFEAIEDAKFKLTDNACQYSLNYGGVWLDLPANTETPTVSAGNKIMFKCTNPSIESGYGIGTFSSTGKFKASGNIMSMLYGDDFIGKRDLSGKDCAFYGLFSGCTELMDASKLILPATKLTSECYNSMFYGCTSLVNAPALPATTLAYRCYYGMFYGCTSLTTAQKKLPATTLDNECYGSMFACCTSLVNAPELPATTLAESCYIYMFYGCTALVTTPELPAITLTWQCYYSMFSGCTSLNQITMLATDISALDCLSDWVSGVASTGTFYRHKNMISLPIGNNGIPEDWEVIPPLPISLCDIAYWNGSAVKTVSKDNWTASLGTPIGVVVIPSGMLPDGKARMINLTSIDANGSATTSYVKMVYGPTNTDTSLTNYTAIPTTDNAGSTSTGSNLYGYLPSDAFADASSYVDNAAKYNGWTPYIPSPYLYNGGELAFNPEYSKAISGYNNALSDFNGLSNTETLVDLGTDYQAANAAWKYSDGVSNTQWYLPSMGELGFLMPRFNEINSTLTSIGGVAVANSSHWASTEVNSETGYHLSISSGGVGDNDKNDGDYIRAFAKLI